MTHHGRHASFTPAAKFSLKPTHRCTICGELLWSERSPRTHRQEWLFAREDCRHFKTRRHLKPAGETDDAP